MNYINVSKEQYWDLALHNSHIGYFLVDQNQVVTYCNPYFETLIGLSDLQIVNRPHSFLFEQIAALSRDPAQTLNELDLGLDNLEQRPVVNMFIPYPLTGLWRIELFSLHDLEEQMVGFGGLIHDLTTDWLAVSGQKEYLSILTREIRRPLTTLKGFAGALLDNHRRWNSDERQDCVENIFNGIDQLTEYLENAQELFKLDSGELELEQRPTALKSLINESILRVSSRMRGFHFPRAIPDNLPTIEIDPSRLAQALYNLLCNLLKYAAAGSDIPIEVLLEEGQVVIQIMIECSSMATEQIAQSLMPFPLNHVGRAELGLSIAKHLIEAHSGSLECDRISDYGARIRCVLRPTAQRVKNTKLPAELPSAVVPKPYPSFLRVLIIGSDSVSTQSLKDNLEHANYFVSIASSAKEAFEIISAKRPHIFVLDTPLFDDDGPSFGMKLRTMSASPIIMIATSAKSEDIARALDLGLDDYLPKSARPEEILARIRAVLRRVSNPDVSQGASGVRIGEIWIDFSRRRVRARGKPVRLTPNEFKVLYVLARNAGHVLSYTQILSQIWGTDFEDYKEYLWVNISRLRKKLEENPANPRYIVTEPGIGYSLLTPDGTSSVAT